MLLSEASILFVDDEPALRSIFGLWLTKFGCGVVRTAVNGKDALNALKAAPVDLLITDMRMPEMDGPGLVRSLTELGQTPPILIVSGFANVDAREMYGLGVEAFLQKPLDMGDLLRAIERTMAKRADLWMTPLEVMPRQVMMMAAEGSRESVGADAIRLGRGGFSAPYVGPLMRGAVTFECTFPKRQRVLRGQGYVRWTSRADQTVGIEFAFLHPSCRDWVLEEINATRPPNFIPSLLPLPRNSPRAPQLAVLDESRCSVSLDRESNALRVPAQLR
jgi:CheY-like chemotaxis protein